MKAIVTGSAGFIGRHLCEYLRQRGDEVISIDIDEENPVDLFDVGIPCDADVLYHLAADPAKEEPRTGREFNTDMADDVLTWHARHPNSMVVFASTWMVSVPGSLYGESKLQSESMLCQEIPHDKLRIIRLPNIYGPGGHGVLDLWKTALANGEPIVIHGDGSQKRQFIPVGEAVKVLADPPGNTLTQIVGLKYSLAELARMVDPKGERTKIVPRRDQSPEIVELYHMGSDIVGYVSPTCNNQQWKCRACGRVSEPFDRDFEAPLGWSSVHVRDGQGVDDFHYCEVCTKGLHR